MSVDLQKAGKVVVKPSGCKPGSYAATFVGAYKLPPREGGPDFGPALIVKFRADDGQEPSAIVSETPTLRNACGRILAGMLGRPLRPEEAVDWADFEGQKFLVVVVTNKSQTGTTIGDVTRM
jgi:hypothetical protein